MDFKEKAKRVFISKKNLITFFLILLLPISVWAVLEGTGFWGKAKRGIKSEGIVIKRSAITGPKYAKGEVLIKFKQQIVLEDKNAKENTISGQEVREGRGSDILRQIDDKFPIEKVKKILPSSKIKQQGVISGLNNFYKIYFDDKVDIEKAVKFLKEYPEIENAAPNYFLYQQKIPNDTKFADQWHLNQSSDADIDGPEAWDITVGSENQVVAVIDSGIDFNHPDLKDKIYINLAEYGNGKESNGIDDDNNGYIDDWRGWNFVADNNNSADDNGHGTHVGGIIGATTDNNLGVAGISWNSPLMAIKVCNSTGSCRCDDVVEAIYYAADQTKIINMSLGGASCLGGQEAINYAIANDTLIVAAAGNYNNSIPIYPANYKGVIAAAATNKEDKKAYFSSYGDWVDISAPGQDIWSTILSGKRLSQTCNDTDGDGYDDCSGTSMASPVVAGVAALVKFKYPNLNNDDVKMILLLSSDNIDGENPEYEKRLGKGRVNAEQALTKTVFSEITSPTNRYKWNQAVVKIYGTAWAINTAELNYELDYSLDGQNWLNEGISYPNEGNKTAIINGVLGSLETASLENGEYILRLRVNAREETSESRSKFIFDRDAPVVLQPGWPQLCGSCEGSIPYSFNFQEGTNKMLGTYTLNESKIWNYDGTSMSNWPPEDITNDPIMYFVSMFNMPADYDSDGEKEIFVFSKGFHRQHGDWADRFYWYDKDGNQLMKKGFGWKKQMETIQIRAISITDINGDSIPEIIIVSDKWEYYLGVDGVYHIRILGSELTVYNTNFEVVWSKFIDGFRIVNSQQSLAVGDVENDGKKEIFIGLKTIDLDPVTKTTSRVYAFKNDGLGLTNDEGIFNEYDWFDQVADYPYNIVLGDLNYDGYKEVIIKYDYTRLRAFDRNGSLMWEKDLTLETYEIGPLAIGDINNNGDLEIIFSTTVLKAVGDEYKWYFQLRGYKHDGSGYLNSDGILYENFLGYYDYHAGTPFYYPAAVVLGDINGDFKIDIITNYRLGDKLYSFATSDEDGNGAIDILPGWPVSVIGNLTNFNAIAGDIDRDGDTEIQTLAVRSGVGADMYIFSSKGQNRDRKLVWPMGRYNEFMTGEHPKLSLPIPTNTPVPATPTITPTPTIVPVPSPPENPGKALSLDGGSYVDIKDDNQGLALSDNFTIEAWIRPEEIDEVYGLSNILSRYSPTYGARYSLFISGSDKIRLHFVMPSLGQMSEKIIPMHSWSHIAVVKNGNTISGYLNGQKFLEKSGTLGDLSDENNSLTYIGVWKALDFTGRYYNGLIDDLRISNIARDIEANWKNKVYYESLEADENTLALWHFEGDLKDAGKNAKDGVVFGNISYPDGIVPKEINYECKREPNYCAWSYAGCMPGCDGEKGWFCSDDPKINKCNYSVRPDGPLWNCCREVYGPVPTATLTPIPKPTYPTPTPGPTGVGLKCSGSCYSSLKNCNTNCGLTDSCMQNPPGMCWEGAYRCCIWEGISPTLTPTPEGESLVCKGSCYSSLKNCNTNCAYYGKTCMQNPPGMCWEGAYRCCWQE